MTKFTDNLWSDLAREHGATLAHADRPEPGRGRRPRPRVLAGGTLGLAGVGAALVVALSAGSAAAPPALAITTHDDGSVLVTLNGHEDIGQANQKLAAMGINEQITLYSNPNPTAASGPESCIPGPGAGVPNPPVKLAVNTGNAGNTGTTGAVVCVVGPQAYSGPYPGNPGDTGSGNSGTTTAGSKSAG